MATYFGGPFSPQTYLSSLLTCRLLQHGTLALVCSQECALAISTVHRGQWGRLLDHALVKKGKQLTCAFCSLPSSFKQKEQESHQIFTCKYIQQEGQSNVLGPLN